jgi:mono/diheme cytochrome c family protein
MMRKSVAAPAAALIVMAGIAAGGLRAAETAGVPTYTATQAARGQAIYSANCAECHGKNLDDGEFAAALKGPQFAQHFGGHGLDMPYTIMTTQMPPTNPGSLPPQAYADVLAYVLSQNGVAANADKELPADAAALKAMTLPAG